MQKFINSRTNNKNSTKKHDKKNKRICLEVYKQKNNKKCNNKNTIK